MSSVQQAAGRRPEAARGSTGNAIAKPPKLGLYVHFPWCVKKCPYCDFNSHPLHGELPEDTYVHALTSEFRARAHSLRRDDASRFDSLFFGGGTPSLFPRGPWGRSSIPSVRASARPPRSPWKPTPAPPNGTTWPPVATSASTGCPSARSRFRRNISPDSGAFMARTKPGPVSRPPATAGSTTSIWTSCTDCRARRRGRRWPTWKRPSPVRRTT